jgi:hypothetical protein
MDGEMSWQVSFVCLFLVSCCIGGCATHTPDKDPTPVMNADEGAITGKLESAGGDRFDLSLAGIDPLQIQLLNPDHGVVATTAPLQGKPRFIFDHVKPGTYELSVYGAVRGQRTIAGSEPVTVDAGQITPATLTLQVTSEDEKVTR